MACIYLIFNFQNGVPNVSERESERACESDSVMWHNAKVCKSMNQNAKVHNLIQKKCNYGTEITISTLVCNIKYRGSTYTKDCKILDRGNT